MSRGAVSKGLPKRGPWVAAAFAAAIALAIAWSVAALAQSEPTFPRLSGRIVDNAKLLTPQDRAAIEADLAALEEKSTDQLVVVTLPSLQGFEIEDYGYRLGRRWGIGQAGEDNGVILLVAPNEKRVRIEVGRGLEPIVTDLMSRIIIENAIIPQFRRGDFSGGIRAGVRDLTTVLLGDGEAVKQRAKGLNRNDGPSWMTMLLIAFWIAIVVYVVYAQIRYAQSQPQVVGRRGRRGGRSADFGAGAGSGTWGSGGGWSGGGWSGGGGGGWSGGGGGFGGGGGSGSW